jgi:hypothetical protein
VGHQGVSIGHDLGIDLGMDHLWHLENSASRTKMVGVATSGPPLADHGDAGKEIGNPIRVAPNKTWLH